MSHAVADDVLGYVKRHRAEMPRSVLETLVLGAYQRHAISGGLAAETLGLRLDEFCRLASAAGIAVLDQSPDELADDLRALDRHHPGR